MISAWRRDTRSALPLSAPRSISGTSPPSDRPTIVRLCISPKRDALPIAASHAPAFICESDPAGEAPLRLAFLPVATQACGETTGAPDGCAVLARAASVPQGAFFEPV